MRVLIVSSNGLVVDRLRDAFRSAGVWGVDFHSVRAFFNGLPDFTEGGEDRRLEYGRVFVLIDGALCTYAKELQYVFKSLAGLDAPIRGLVMGDCLHDFIPELRAVAKVDVLPTDTEAERCTAAALELMPGADRALAVLQFMYEMGDEAWAANLDDLIDEEGEPSLVAEIRDTYATVRAQKRAIMRSFWSQEPRMIEHLASMIGESEGPDEEPEELRS